MITELKTNRLIIRHYREEDWQDALAFLGSQEAMYYLPEPPRTEEMVKQLISKQSSKTEYYAVTMQNEDKVIGHIYFGSIIEDHTYEIGWIFNQQYQGAGYATEAARAVLDCGFNKLGIHRVFATCNPANRASSRVMEHLGMRQEGWFKESVRAGDEWWDDSHYAILAKEWQQGGHHDS